MVFIQKKLFKRVDFTVITAVKTGFKRTHKNVENIIKEGTIHTKYLQKTFKRAFNRYVDYKGCHTS